MSETNYTVVNAMVDIIASPGKALDNLKDRASWCWYPLLTVIVLSCLAFVYYYNWVDFDWFIEQTLSAMSPEEREAGGDAARSFMSPTMLTGMTIIGVVVGVLLIYSIQALYLHLAAKLATSGEFRYGQWFNFSAWTAFVGIFGVLAMFVVMFLADNNQVSQDQLSPFSMNSLFIHAREGEDWFNWGNSLNLTHFWTLALMSLGFARWTGESLAKSTVIAVLPWALIFGIWALTI